MKKTTAKKAPKASPKKPIVAKRFRCEICGFASEKPGEHCGYPLTDLLSSGCMACKGCGMHL